MRARYIARNVRAACVKRGCAVWACACTRARARECISRACTRAVYVYEYTCTTSSAAPAWDQCDSKSRTARSGSQTEAAQSPRYTETESRRVRQGRDSTRRGHHGATRELLIWMLRRDVEQREREQSRFRHSLSRERLRRRAALLLPRPEVQHEYVCVRALACPGLGDPDAFGQRFSPRSTLSVRNFAAALRPTGPSLKFGILGSPLFNSADSKLEGKSRRGFPRRAIG
jgi:hypothetical protein